MNPRPKARYHLVVIGAGTGGLVSAAAAAGLGASVALIERHLGATLVAEHAGEMISEITLAIVNRVGLGAIGRTMHPYPTQAEIFRKAADTWRRGKLTPRVRRLLDLYFRLFR